MLGIIVQLVISWLLLWLFEKKNLSVLGLKPTTNRVKHFITGLLLPVTYFVLLFLLLANLGKNPYHLNEHYTWNNFIQSAFYLFKSVAFETLIFNGALLYILAKRIGPNKSILITAIAFGIYHWFSWNLFGNAAAMAMVFFSTGVMGYFWSMAYVRTGTIWLPFALHYGVNFALNILLSKDKGMGDQLFVQTYKTDPYSSGVVITVLAMFFFYAGFPLLMWWYLRRIKGCELLNKAKNVQVSDTRGYAIKN